MFKKFKISITFFSVFQLTKATTDKLSRATDYDDKSNLSLITFPFWPGFRVGDFIVSGFPGTHVEETSIEKAMEAKLVCHGSSPVRKS